MCLTEYNEEFVMDALRRDSKEEGLEQGIKAMILDNLEDGKSEEVICAKLVKHFQLTLEDAQGYINKFSGAFL